MERLHIRGAWNGLNYPEAVYINRIHYKSYPISRHKRKTTIKSIKPVGLDTEARPDGTCFLICTSLGDVFTYNQFPDCLFNRRYKNSVFVCYNLSYDSGALIAWLPKSNIIELWKYGATAYGSYVVKSIAKKFLRITKNNKDSVTFYDMLNFYRGAGTKGRSSLDAVAEKILGERKIDITTKRFTDTYIKKHWSEIVEYCIQDAVLVERLADRIIKQFEQWGVYPRSLYSTAYIAYQYFSCKTKYVTVRRFWKNDRMLLDYAMQSYNGGKFEVTRKGADYYYEYDITSAYPYEIANLIDISNAEILKLPKYDNTATYAFLKCLIKIPENVYSPVAKKYGAVNIYPVGHLIKVITKNEYEYLVKNGCEIQVVDGYHIYCKKPDKPYNEEILRLFEYKKKYKYDNNKLLYHTIKILLNSLYGKFAQIIKTPDVWNTSTCWNPIYASIITANTRIRVSEMQQKYNSVMAVHTDSIITNKKLDIPLSKELGAWDHVEEGNGVILGSGVYQVGKTSKFRGFQSKIDLLDFINIKRSKRRIYATKAVSWREAAFRGWDVNMINRFIKADKWLNVRFDKKRVWINDYRLLSDALKRKVYSLPYVVDWLDSVLRVD